MTAVAASAAARQLGAYRDDGPVAGAIGAVAGRIARVSPSALVALGVLPLIALMAVERDGASDAVAGAAIAWMVVLAGASAGRPDEGRFRWVAAPLLRAGEYGTLIWLGAIAGGSGVAAAFALLGALAFRHYDTVYRMRHQATEPPRWLSSLAGGWAGRLIVAWVLLVAGVFSTGVFVAAGLLGAVFVAESVSSWVRPGAPRTTDVFEEDDEDEGVD